MIPVEPDCQRKKDNAKLKVININMNEVDNAIFSWRTIKASVAIPSYFVSAKEMRQSYPLGVTHIPVLCDDTYFNSGQRSMFEFHAMTYIAVSCSDKIINTNILESKKEGL